MHVSGCQAPVVMYSGFRTQARFQKSKKWRRNKTKQFRKAKERKEHKTKTNTLPKLPQTVLDNRHQGKTSTKGP